MKRILLFLSCFLLLTANAWASGVFSTGGSGVFVSLPDCSNIKIGVCYNLNDHKMYSFNGTTVAEFTGASMIYPDAGIAYSNGSAWGTPLVLDTDMSDAPPDNGSVPSTKAVSDFFSANIPTIPAASTDLSDTADLIRTTDINSTIEPIHTPHLESDPVITMTGNRGVWTNADNDPIEWDLPAATAGDTHIFQNPHAQVMTIKPSALNYLIYQGTTLTQGASQATPGTIGEAYIAIAIDSNYWFVTKWPTSMFAADYPTSAGVLAALVTLSGVTSGSDGLGSFTGATIPDDSTVKAALQAIETALETVAASTPVDTSLTFTKDGWPVYDFSESAWASFYPDDTTLEFLGTDLRIKDAGVSAAKLGTDADDDAIEFVIDGGGSEIATGVKGCLEIPWAGTISAALVAAPIESGSISIDVWVDSYANFPPTDADSITASAPVAMTAAQTGSSDLTGWTTSITKGQWVCFNVDSVTTTTLATVSLKVDR